jgi:hypothetical protein
VLINLECFELQSEARPGTRRIAGASGAFRLWTVGEMRIREGIFVSGEDVVGGVN